MIIDVDTRSATFAASRSQHGDDQFRQAMAQSLALPLFAPWVSGEPNARPGSIAAGTALNTHPTASNRREGRHAHR